MNGTDVDMNSAWRGTDGAAALASAGATYLTVDPVGRMAGWRR